MEKERARKITSGPVRTTWMLKSKRRNPEALTLNPKPKTLNRGFKNWNKANKWQSYIGSSEGDRVFDY